jgi:LmbE family N-acetylglucosaminyl deacetylase
MSSAPLRLLILGAHPDDAEFHAGGLILHYVRAGHVVKMVSATDGGAGHQTLSGPPLTEIRSREARAAAQLVGATAELWPFPDGRLEPSLELRERVIREIRSFRPDLVLTHRTCDYHPDHRAIGQSVQDASYLVTVPSICPDAPILRRDPVVATMNDRFTRPTPMRADVILDISAELPEITRMCACHASQFFDWLPFNQQKLAAVPTGEAARLDWLADQLRDHLRTYADRFRAELIATYGPRRGVAAELAEAFEISEYAAPLDADARRRLFWFLPEEATP